VQSVRWRVLISGRMRVVWCSRRRRPERRGGGGGAGAVKSCGDGGPREGDGGARAAGGALTLTPTLT